MAVANEVEKRPVSKKQAASDGTVERERLRMMMLIRRFEERTYRAFTEPGQKIGGFCHLYSGQEAIAVGTAAIFDKNRDALINGLHAHGHPAVTALMSPKHLAAVIDDIAKPGDMVVCLGAGNITAWAGALPAQLAALQASTGRRVEGAA